MSKTQTSTEADTQDSGPLWNLPLDAQKAWWEKCFTGPSFRLKQVRDWVYTKGIFDSSRMLNIPDSLKEELNRVSPPQLSRDEHLVSSEGTADKFLFTTRDGERIESVLLRSGPRRTVCMSTQVGCALKCRFCNTGLSGFKRDLSPAEMVEQVLQISDVEQERISNIVVMGMGEPMLNYDKLMIALRQINSPHGLNLGARHVTVSTSGVKGSIRRFAHEPEQWGLAISLHAADDALRTDLMPINRSLPLSELVEDIDYYIAQTNRRVSFEYILLGGVNDGVEQARQLVPLIRGKLCHVNLIPYNPVPSLPYSSSSASRIRAFKDILDSAAIPCTLRHQKGQDILAACGQLAHKRNTSA